MPEQLLKKKIDVVILCGGIGSRIKKMSKGIPKSLVNINNKNILTYILNDITKYNFNKIFLLTGYKSHQFKKYNKKKINFIPIECIKENKPMGTGGALHSLKKKKINDFILLNGDTTVSVNYLKLIEASKNKIGTMTLIKNYNYKSNNKLANLSLIKGVVSFEKKNDLMNAGVYFLKKNFLEHITKKEFSLENDLLKKYIKKKKINGYQTDSFFIDIGTPSNLNRAPKLLYNRNYKPAAFLDRDGVINYDYGYVHRYKDFILRPNVLKGLKLLKKRNYKIFIITNQAGIAKNIFKIDDFFKLHSSIKNFFLKNNIGIDEVIYCPHHSSGVLKKYKKSCKYRKPNNGMIKIIQENHDVDIKKSFMIGDKISDKKCADKSKIYFEYAKKDFYIQIKNILKK